jgi:hypothetical protein
VTTSRLISHDRGRSTSLRHDEIESIHQLPVDDGEHITVIGPGGRRITFLIFSGDDADGLIDALAAERVRSGT